MAAYDLCTLADVKAWLGRSDTNSDAVLAVLLTRTSRQILSYLRRPTVLPHSVAEIRDGTGGETLVLREWPVLSVTTLVIGAVNVAQAPFNTACGFLFEPWSGTPPGRAQAIALNGFCFVPAAQNVSISYRAGYQVTAEAQTVANGSATVIGPYGSWASDGGVTYANGTPLVQVSGAPSPGQYQLTPGTPGSYTFNAADSGQTVLVTYGYVPEDLADAAIELVAERFKYAQRIGERAHSLGGNETVAFDNARLTPLVTGFLAPYRHVLPI
ncbi:MAG TPA: hypothetical protein VF835_06350 [Rhizomicrobium sp.]